jgi:hypothetical protein
MTPASFTPDLVTVTFRGPGVRRRCFLYAVLCASIGWLWQAATVHRNYQGNWTALFCVGGLTHYPDLPGENIYRFAGSHGFDGQFYYLIAHDPSPSGALASAIDTPDLRYERILVPLLAYIAALGNPRAIAFSYAAVNLVFLFLGSWWIARTVALHGATPAWALAFLLIPAVPISLDRMTVDLALVALAAGAFYFWETHQLKKLFATLALMCLTRDTGAIVVLAFVAFFLARRKWKPAAAALAAAIPFALWFGYVLALHPLRSRPWLPIHPFVWTWNFLIHPPPYAFSPSINFAIHLLDLAAFAGLSLGVAAAVFEARDKTLSPARVGNLFFCVLAVYLLSLDEWTHVYDFGRVLSPLMLNLLVCGIVSRRWWFLAAPCLITLRVAAQMAPQILGVLKLSS